MPYDSNLVFYAQATIAYQGDAVWHVQWRARSCYHTTVWSIVERSFEQHSSTNKINSRRCMARKKGGTLSLKVVQVNTIVMLLLSLTRSDRFTQESIALSTAQTTSLQCTVSQRWLVYFSEGKFIMNKHVLYPQSQLHSGSDRSLQTWPTFIIS